MSKVVEKFLRYVKIDTQSDDTSGKSPSTASQHDLAALLFDELKATAIVKGIRNEKDLEYELIHAKWNKEHNERAETMFLPADEDLCSVSSTMVRELISERKIDKLEGIIHKKTLEWIKNIR